MKFAPEFDKTIFHQNLNDHFAATLEGRDVSSMERVYRWVAAINMSREHPIVGYGPGNFYNFYRSYTITSFRTYVSNNPERSGVHNYFLMMLVEQGVPGMLIWIALCAVLFIYGEQIYRKQTDPQKRRLVMAILLAQFVIVFNLLLNDLIETLKIGSIFFMLMAILINLDHAADDQENTIAEHR